MASLIKCIRRGIQTSAVWSVLTATNGSRSAASIYTLVSQSSRFARESFVYQWLAKYPEPGVIVVDPLETRTIAPLFNSLHSLSNQIVPYWESSTVSTGINRCRDLVDYVTRTRIAKYVSRLLVPEDFN